MNRLTASGIWAFLLGVAFIASSSRDSRLEVAGFLIHPALILGVASLPFLANQLRQFPRMLIRPLIIVTVAIWVVTFADLQRVFGVATKLTANLAFTAATFAMIRTRKDYRAGVIGLLIGVSVIGVLGLASGQDIGVETFNPLQTIGNKNAFSLLGLPAVLLGIELAMRARTPTLTRVTTIIGCGTIAVVTFVSANRSGWLSLAFILAMVLTVNGIGFRKIATGALVAGGVYFLLANVFGTGVVERRYNQTMEGYSSDSLRLELLRGCFWSGVNHPILGAGPGTLPRELAAFCRDVVDADVLAPHNSITYIFGLGGVVLLLPFLWLGWTLITFGRRVGSQPPLVRMLVALWVVRGFFSDEVLFAPAFAFALGLVIAEQTLAMVEVSQIQRAGAVGKTPSVAMPPCVGGPQLATSQNPAQ